MTAQHFRIRYAQDVFGFDYAEDLNLDEVVQNALQHFGLQVQDAGVKLRSCLDFTEVKTLETLKELLHEHDNLARTFCLCVNGAELNYHFEEDVLLEGEAYGTKELLGQQAENLYDPIDVISELIDNAGQSAWSKATPNLELFLDVVREALGLDDNGQGIHPSAGAVVAQLMKSGNTNKLQAEQAKKDSLELWDSIGRAGPRASLFLNRQFKISEYGFGLKAVGVLLCGQKQGCLEVETKTADQRPMTFRRTYGTGEGDRFMRCGGSSNVTGTKASYTYVRLQGVDINHLWGSKTASAGRACLRWAEDITKGLHALYQLYLHSLRPYAKRLADLICWQDPRHKGVKWIDNLSARHRTSFKAMANKALLILQQTASYGGPDVRKRLHLKVFVQHAEGASGLKQICEPPKKTRPSLSGDSYVERVLQSAAACCPLGLDIPATSGSEGGYLLLLVVMLKWDHEVDRAGPEFPQGLHLSEAVAFMESRQFTRGLELLNFLDEALRAPSNVSKHKQDVLSSIGRDRLHAIAFVPRTCKTTLGKTTVERHDPIIATAKEMLVEHVPEVREFLFQAAKDHSPPFRLPEAGRLVQHGQPFIINDIVQLQQSNTDRHSNSNDLGSEQPLLYAAVYFKIISFSLGRASAESEASSLAQQSYKCCLQPLHAPECQLNVVLGGPEQLLLKAKTNRELTALQITNALPAGLAWPNPSQQVAQGTSCAARLEVYSSKRSRSATSAEAAETVSNQLLQDLGFTHAVVDVGPEGPVHANECTCIDISKKTRIGGTLDMALKLCMDGQPVDLTASTLGNIKVQSGHFDHRASPQVEADEDKPGVVHVKGLLLHAMVRTGHLRLEDTMLIGLRTKHLSIDMREASVLVENGCPMQMSTSIDSFEACQNGSVMAPAALQLKLLDVQANQASLEGHKLAVTGAIQGRLPPSPNQQSPVHIDLRNIRACSPIFASSTPAQLSGADYIVPIFSGCVDIDNASPLGLGTVLPGSHDIQHVILRGDLVTFQKQANHPRQIGVVQDIEWPSEPPQPCSRQDSHLKLSLISVAGPVPPSPYQLARKPTPSKVAFSAVISTAAVLSAEEHDAAFPQEELASPAVTCLKDQGGRVQRLVREVFGREQRLPPAWRRLELLVQALGVGRPIQSAICMPLDIDIITPSSVPARLDLVVDAMLHEAQPHKEGGSWTLLAPAKQVVDTMRINLHDEGGSPVQQLQHRCQVECQWDRRHRIHCNIGQPGSTLLPEILMPAVDDPKQQQTINLFQDNVQSAAHSISLTIQPVPKQHKQPKVRLGPVMLGEPFTFSLALQDAHGSSILQPSRWFQISNVTAQLPSGQTLNCQPDKADCWTRMLDMSHLPVKLGSLQLQLEFQLTPKLWQQQLYESGDPIAVKVGCKVDFRAGRASTLRLDVKNEWKELSMLPIGLQSVDTAGNPTAHRGKALTFTARVGGVSALLTRSTDRAGYWSGQLCMAVEPGVHPLTIHSEGDIGSLQLPQPQHIQVTRACFFSSLTMEPIDATDWGQVQAGADFNVQVTLNPAAGAPSILSLSRRYHAGLKVNLAAQGGQEPPAELAMDLHKGLTFGFTGRTPQRAGPTVVKATWDERRHDLLEAFTCAQEAGQNDLEAIGWQHLESSITIEILPGRVATLDIYPEEHAIVRDPQCDDAQLQVPTLAYGHEVEAMWDEGKAAFYLPEAALAVRHQRLGNGQTVAGQYELQVLDSGPLQGLRGAWQFTYSDRLSQQQEQAAAETIIKEYGPQEKSCQKARKDAMVKLNASTQKVKETLASLHLPEAASSAILIAEHNKLLKAILKLKREREGFLNDLDAEEPEPTQPTVLGQALRRCMSIDSSWLAGRWDMQQASQALQALVPSPEEVDLSEDTVHASYGLVQAKRCCLQVAELPKLTKAVGELLKYHINAEFTTHAEASRQSELEHHVILTDKPDDMAAPFQSTAQAFEHEQVPEGCLGLLADFVTVEGPEDQMICLRASLERFCNGAVVFRTAEQACLFWRQRSLHKKTIPACIILDSTCCPSSGPSLQDLIISPAVLEAMTMEDDKIFLAVTVNSKSRLVLEVNKLVVAAEQRRQQLQQAIREMGDREEHERNVAQTDEACRDWLDSPEKSKLDKAQQLLKKRKASNARSSRKKLNFNSPK
ncbi:hypothetical protein WJX74_003009 [Apatococcus lobatus]|uniref:Uncharacterized protein n=1 Tax=Apatococcus lobatus TaxID=904363 RepID=A0AAW1Q9P4_9CHLO